MFEEMIRRLEDMGRIANILDTGIKKGSVTHESYHSAEDFMHVWKDEYEELFCRVKILEKAINDAREIAEKLEGNEE